MAFDSLKKSDFWIKKLHTAALAQDVDKDGFVTRKDFDTIIQYYKDTGAPPEHVKNLRENFDKLYVVWGLTDENRKVTVEDFVEMWREKVDEIFALADDIISGWFKQVDINADGKISIEEWLIHNAALKLDSETAKKSFEAMDTNGDGVVSAEEFKAYHFEFFFSAEDKLKSSILFGPLV